MAQNTHFALAIHVLVALAIRNEGFVPSADLAKSINTNAAFLRNLLGKLREAGFVEIKLGAGGGTRLARPAKGISLDELRQTLTEGPCMNAHHSVPDHSCLVGRNILSVLDELAQELETTLTKTLRKKTIADLAKEVMRRG